MLMKRKKLWIALTALMLLAAVPAFSMAAANYGAASVTTGQAYTLEQMLTYAIQDEYLAQAEYTAIINAYKTGAPFANSLKAESNHISLLTKLFDTYGIAVPENTAQALTTVPGSLDEAYDAGMQAESANIAMYDTFLAQTDLPEDVRNTFTALKNASENHLNAYTRNSGKTGNGRNNTAGCFGNGYGASQRGMMNANCPAAQANGQCPMAQSSPNGGCPMNSRNGSRMGMGMRGGNAGVCNGTCTATPQD
jgi:hypothetical protein